MHLDDKTILFSSTESIDYLRRVATRLGLIVSRLLTKPHRWRRWPHFAIAANLRRPGRNAVGGGRGQQPGAHLIAIYAGSGSGDWPSARPDARAVADRRRGEAADRRESFAGEMLGAAG